MLQSINPATPYGKRRFREIKPFTPGQEAALKKELERVDTILLFMNENQQKFDLLSEIFHDMKEVAFTVARSAQNALTVVELFELKNFLLQCNKISELVRGIDGQMPMEFRILDTSGLLDELDPRRERMNTFYIYDEFSERLSSYRMEKRELELSIRKEKKEIKKQLEQSCGISMTPKFDLAVSKSNQELLNLCRSLPELALESEDYMTAVFQIRSNHAVHEMIKRMEHLNELVEEEELAVRERLSSRVHNHADVILKNCDKIGALDFTMAKASHARSHQCTKPVIIDDHVLNIEEGRHLQVEGLIKAKGKEYCPISVKLHDGVSCITGANMGGKTVSLKLIGLTALMTQYGLFVPCKKAEIGLSSYIHILIGDIQSMQRGLSSFGGEMEELKDILDHSISRSLLLIDEIASGTNPVEGLALTKSIINYLNQKPYITVITTHFDNAAVDNSVQNMQVRGLANADMKKLIRELRNASRRERIEVISRYMDYRLYTVGNQEEIPKDALNIAKMLGIDDEIINNARKYMNKGGTV